MQKQILILDSKYRTNFEDTDGQEYKFKLTKNIKFNGYVRLEQFLFQNSQYVFSNQKRSDKFIYTDYQGNITIITLQGKFDTTNDFVKRFNELTSTLNIKMQYTPYLYEFQIQHLNGNIFNLSEYYDDGIFMQLIGFNKVNQGSNVYTNINIPKLFSQSLTYIAIPEFGTLNAITLNSIPYTFTVLSQQGFEIVSNINNTFDNSFYVSDKNLDELTVRIKGSDGLPFVNNKGNANVILVLSYY